MKDEDVLKVLTKVFQKPVTELDLTDLLEELDYDSLRQLELLANIDSYGFTLTGQDLESARTLGDLFNLLKALS